VTLSAFKLSDKIALQGGEALGWKGHFLKIFLGVKGLNFFLKLWSTYTLSVKNIFNSHRFGEYAGKGKKEKQGQGNFKYSKMIN